MTASTLTPSFLQAYWQDAFSLKQHLQDFLHLDPETVEQRLAVGQQQLTELGKRDFDWEKAQTFYQDLVGEAYLFDLGAWHLSSQEYIGGTLKLIADFAQGRVLDFGGGIGTHTIAAALLPDVTEVVYCDLNPISRNFVQSRVNQLGLADKVCCCSQVLPTESFDTIICLDVLEHLPNPTQQLLDFHQILSPAGKIMMNWYFFKGFEQEFPFHLDDPEIIEKFFQTLQLNFLEVFHPHLITARCYRKWNDS